MSHHSAGRLTSAAACMLLVLCLNLAAEATQLKAKAKAARSRLRRHLPGLHPSMLRTLAFKQDLLVCNAYPSASAVEIRRNSEQHGPRVPPPLPQAAKGNRSENHTARVPDVDVRALPFQDCRYIQGRLRSRDRLDFYLQGQSVQASFEVGELPTSDALLLLVVKKREGSAMMTFQDFAFPLAEGQKDAQLAVIDAAVDVNGTSPHLKIEDHMNGDEKETVSKRVEELMFNRVYSVEEGGYDAAIVDPRRPHAQAVEAATRRVVHLRRKKNYVLMRIGGNGFQESLVMYPPEHIAHSAGLRRAVSLALLPLLAMAVATAPVM